MGSRAGLRVPAVGVGSLALALGALWLGCGGDPGQALDTPELAQSTGALDETGTGVDGPLNVTTTITVDDVHAVLTAAADPGSTTLTVDAITGFSPGMEVLLIDLFGADGGRNTELRTLGALVDANHLSLTAAPSRAFPPGTELLRVPQFSQVTVFSGGVLTASAFDGTVGGILAFKSTGALTVQSGGRVTVDGLGMRAGAGGDGGSWGAGGDGGLAGNNAGDCASVLIGQAGRPGGVTPRAPNGGKGARGSGGTCGGGDGGTSGQVGFPGEPGQPGMPGEGAGVIASNGAGGANPSQPDGGVVFLGAGGAGGVGANGGAGGGGGGGGGSPQGLTASPSDGQPGRDGGIGQPGGSGGNGGGVILVWADRITTQGEISARGVRATAGGKGGAAGAGGGGGNGGNGTFGGGGGAGGNGGLPGTGAGGGGGGAGGTVILAARTFQLGATPDLTGGDGGAPGAAGATAPGAFPGSAGTSSGTATVASSQGQMGVSVTGSPGPAGGSGTEGALWLVTLPPPVDGGTDAGVAVDAGTPDAGAADAGAPDAGVPDAGSEADAGTTPQPPRSHYACSVSEGFISWALLGLAGLALRRRKGARATSIALLLVACLAGQTARAEEVGGRHKLAFMGLGSSSGISPSVLAPVSEVIQTELSRRRVYQVMGPREIGTLVGVERQKQLLGCSESSCAAEIAGALDAGRAVSGDLSRVGDSVLLNLSLVDLRGGQSLGRVTRRVVARDNVEPILDVVPGAVAELVAHDAAVRESEEELAAAEGPGISLWVGPRVDADLLSPGVVGGLSVGVRGALLGAGLTALVARTIGVRLEGRIYPLKHPVIQPFAAVGATLFAPDLALRAAVGLEVAIVSGLRLGADVAYEHYVLLSPGTTPDSLLVGGCATWTF